MGRNIKLTKISTKVSHVAYQLSTLHFSSYCSLRTWQPALNAYRCDNHIALCFDLAGVERETIELEVEAQRLILRGVRPAPSPGKGSRDCRQVIALEIESGEFLRQVELPVPVEPEQVTARQENGLLWILLPIQSERGAR